MIVGRMDGHCQVQHVKSPLDWQMAAASVPHPVIPVLAERGGTQLRTPRCTVVVDTREQNPLDFSRFEGWFAGIETRALKLGDYSIAGLEDRCVVERKDLSDLSCSFTADRPVFVHCLRLMSQYPHRLLVITTRSKPAKVSPAPRSWRPNRMTQSLIAALVGWQISFLMYGNSEFFNSHA